MTGTVLQHTTHERRKSLSVELGIPAFFPFFAIHYTGVYDYTGRSVVGCTTYST